MNHSTPGLPVHHQLLEFTQTHAHRVADAIQPSHPLSSPSPPSPNPSQHEGFSQWVNSSHEVAKILEFQLPWPTLKKRQSNFSSTWCLKAGLVLSFWGQRLQLSGYTPVRGPVSNWGLSQPLLYLHLRPWCWERLRARGEGGDRGWDGWMASLAQWMRIWAKARR